MIVYFYVIVYFCVHGVVLRESRCEEKTSFNDDTCDVRIIWSLLWSLLLLPCACVVFLFRSVFCAAK